MTDTTSNCCAGSSCGQGSERAAFPVPLDKQLNPEWLASLNERGEPERFSGVELDLIGMPIGGICTGQVYLGGDGQLWHWDVFKAYGGGYDGPIDPRGFHYARPLRQKSPIEQGFAIRVRNEFGESVRSLNRAGFADITFEGRYPLAQVDYGDAAFPVSVSLTAYSPFIPLDEERSSLPVTILEYTVTNKSEASQHVSLAGWLENMVCRYDNHEGKGVRRNSIIHGARGSILRCTAEPTPDFDPSSLDAYGDMSLALLSESGSVSSCAIVPDGHSGKTSFAEKVFSGLQEGGPDSATRAFGQKTVGALADEFVLQPGESKSVTFAISWYFPRYTGGTVFFFSMEDIPNLTSLKRHYAATYTSSWDVIFYVSENLSDLSSQTKRWVETWYDSTLPYWLLNRVGANVSTLASQTCHWFDNGRFYCWEGVDCCPGTCQHVWQYAHAIARLFPSLERRLREDIDYGVAFCDDGSISYRGESGIGGVDMKQVRPGQAFFAVDGQLGTILRVYREHLTSADSAFLNRLWPRVRKSIEFIMDLDEDGDGLLDGAQFNTLDTSWYGQIPWISSLYLAALAAGKVMAEEVGDHAFVDVCQSCLDIGRSNLVDKLFNGEYFIHRPDPNEPETMDLTEGSYIDQVFGQSYAIHLGLERVIPKAETISALEALWKYNYTSNIGPYRDQFREVKGGRWYAMPGEGGLLMCTWPKGDCNRSNFDQKVLALDVTSEGYLNECMSGFEYQVAGHMVAEGLVEKGLAVARTIHDRYHPSKRNPYNEIECSDHYSRAMSSYAIFLNIAGFRYHGPKSEIEFAPKLTPENFKTAFTAAEGWGSFAQTLASERLEASVALGFGRLCLESIVLKFPTDRCPQANADIDGKPIDCRVERDEDWAVRIVFDCRITIEAGSKLKLILE